MRSLIVFALALLLTGPGLARAEASGGGAAELEEVLIGFADTPAEHEALAGYYRGKAGKSREMAEHHRNMGKRYAAGNAATRQRMQKHCDELAASYEQLAGEFEALATDHDEAAKP